MKSLKKLIARLTICLLMNLSHIPIAKAQNAIKHPKGVLLTNDYFRQLKKTEAKYYALERDFVELDLECRVKGCSESWWDGELFLGVFLSGLVVGAVITYSAK